MTLYTLFSELFGAHAHNELFCFCCCVVFDCGAGAFQTVLDCVMGLMNLSAGSGDLEASFRVTIARSAALTLIVSYRFLKFC